MKRYWLIYLFALATGTWGQAQEVDVNQIYDAGLYYLENNDYRNAEKFLKIARNRYAENGIFTIDYISATLGLSIVYTRLAMVDIAEPYAREAENLSFITKGRYNLLFARTQNLLGCICTLKENYETAAQYFSSGIHILDSIDAHTLDSSEIEERKKLQIECLINYGGICYKLEQFQLAINVYESILTLLKEYKIDDKKFTAKIAHNLGLVALKLEKFNEAENLFLKVIKQDEKIYGANHIHNTITMRILAELYLRRLNQANKTEKYYKEIDRINRLYYLQSLQYMTTEQLKAISYTLEPDYIHFFPEFTCIYYPQDHSIAGWGYDNELFIKGLLLQSNNTIKHSIEESTDSTLIYQRNELLTFRQKILSLQEKDPYSALIPLYEQRAEELEKQIVVNSAAYRENIRQWSVTWDSVRQALKPQQVAIEYMSLPIAEDDILYCALLLRDTCTLPFLINIFKLSDIDSLLPVSTSDSEDIHRTYAYDERGRELSERLWNEVLPYMQLGDTVFFSPTGILHQIAIENLPYDSTHTIGDVYNMVRLSSTRELVKEHTPIKHQNATLYGGIYYTAPANTMAQAHSNKRYEWIYNLPATKCEIDSICTILNDKHVHVDTLSGYKASEESFKALSGKQQNIVHLATHGFYRNDSTIQDPLEKCGLYFMGANARTLGIAQDIQDAEDGIVTAKDISLMDLQDADLVVLSACETGLGDVTGEGVFGLQRAFKMAGAKTLIMSLWQVDDRATQMLMTAFYRYLYSPNMTKHQAFRAAQQEVRNNGFESPYYWAGFILLD